jgi:hypothetical protein
MSDAIGDSVSNLASSADEEDWQDDEDSEEGKLNEDEELGWVMGTISKRLKQLMDRFRQNQMKLHELTQPG